MDENNQKGIGRKNKNSQSERHKAWARLKSAVDDVDETVKTARKGIGALGLLVRSVRLAYSLLKASLDGAVRDSFFEKAATIVAELIKAMKGG